MSEVETAFPMDWHRMLEEYREWSAGKPAPRRHGSVEGVNFMTPEILGYVTAGDRVVEISTGTFMSGRIVGVTVVGDRDHAGNGCAHSWAEVDAMLAVIAR